MKDTIYYEKLVGKTIKKVEHESVEDSDKDYDAIGIEFTDGSTAEFTSCDYEGYRSWIEVRA